MDTLDYVADVADQPAGTSGFVSFVRAWNLSQSQETPALHVEIARWLDRCPPASQRRSLLQVFRGAGKSTLVGLFCAWLLTRDPNRRIIVVSADQALACKMTRNVRRMLETLDAGTRSQGRRSGEWAADRLTVERSAIHRDPSLLARGIDCIVTGARADLIICDDVEVPSTCDTPLKRQNLRAILRELSFVLVPGGQMLYVGTPHSYYSIYADEARPEADEDRPFLAHYDRLTIPVLREGVPAWPERFTMDEIDRVRAESGPLLFRSQMMLEPADPRRVRLDPDHLVRYEGALVAGTANGLTTWTIDGNPMRAHACCWDPALARNERADSSVIAMVFEDFTGKLWLHDVSYMRPHTPAGGSDETEMARQVCEFLGRNSVRTLHVETNGLGALHPTLLKRWCLDRKMTVSIVGHNSTRNKGRRIIEAFDATLTARRLHVHASVWATPFIQEMRAWQLVGNCKDDGLDAVGACIDLLPVRPAALAAASPRLRLRAGMVYRARTDFTP